MTNIDYINDLLIVYDIKDDCRFKNNVLIFDLDIIYYIVVEKNDFTIEVYREKYNKKQNRKVKIEYQLFQNWIDCCDRLKKIKDNLKYRLENNTIKNNEKVIEAKLIENHITEYKFNYNSYGELMLTTSKNSRDYQITVDELGYIHLYSLNLARNATRKFHYSEKRVQFSTWDTCLNRVSTAHCKYKPKHNMFDKLKQK